MDFVEMIAYDGSVVRVPKSKIDEFKKLQTNIKNQLKNGVSEKEILEGLKNGKK
jgi:uncharacterized protein YbaA (DUF1428 family)